MRVRAGGCGLPCIAGSISSVAGRADCRGWDGSGGGAREKSSPENYLLRGRVFSVRHVHVGGASPVSHRFFAAIRRSSLPGGVRRVKPPRSGPVGLGLDAVRGIGTLAGADDGRQFTSLRICDQIRETERARFGLLECRSPLRTAGAVWGGVVGGVLCRALMVRQKVARENRLPLAFIGVAVPVARGPPRAPCASVAMRGRVKRCTRREVLTTRQKIAREKQGLLAISVVRPCRDAALAQCHRKDVRLFRKKAVAHLLIELRTVTLPQCVAGHNRPDSRTSANVCEPARRSPGAVARNNEKSQRVISGFAPCAPRTCGLPYLRASRPIFISARQPT